MFSGIQEILVLVIIILAIFFIPRLLAKGTTPKASETRSVKIIPKLSGRMRLAILASILWILLTTMYFQPWRKDFVVFLYSSVSPLLAGWGLYWVIIGFKRKNRW
jgi:hypothetical protein